jgi:hypothetical protein
MLVSALCRPFAQERIIIEEHAVWQKNIPQFYDTQVSHALEWTSLTVQWMPPSFASSASGPSSAAHLLLGTHAFEHQPNFLLVAQVQLPVGEGSVTAADAMDVAGDSSGAAPLAKARRHAPTAISVRQKIYLDSEVNRARAMVRCGPRPSTSCPRFIVTTHAMLCVTRPLVSSSSMCLPAPTSQLGGRAHWGCIIICL